MKNKQKDFSDLISEVKNCNLCPRMCGRTKVLSENNGNIDSKVMFIAEAPGRLGAERTGIPLHGDQTGDNFEELLNSINWKRKDIFITNAVLCNPQNDSGNNATPRQEEINNCNDYLKRTIELVNPDVIVTLGGKALKALSFKKNHSFILSEAAAKKLPWNDKILFPLYHPSSTVINCTRNLEEQEEDYKKLSSIVDPLTGNK